MWIMLIATTASACVTGQDRRRSVEHQRRQQVRQLRRGAVGRDAPERIGIGVGRLPCQVRQRRGEVHGMLAGAARDLQHDPLRGQRLAQDREDRLAVARHRGCGQGALDERRCHAGLLQRVIVQLRTIRTRKPRSRAGAGPILSGPAGRQAENAARSCGAMPLRPPSCRARRSRSSPPSAERSCRSRSR